MLILSSTTQSLEIILAGTVTTNQVDWTAHYADDATGTLTEGSSNGVTNNATAVTMVAAPGASTKRMIKNLTVYNADTASATFTISLNDNGTKRVILKKTLGAATQWIYDSTAANGSGDVIGPASATDLDIAVFDGTTGKLLKDSGLAYTNLTTLSGVESITGAKTFDKDKILMKGTSTGATTISTANTSASNYTITMPAATGTIVLGGGTASGTNTGDQTITNSSDATSHTVTLSASGGSVQLIEGSNITLTTGGTSSAGTVTIAATGGGSVEPIRIRIPGELVADASYHQGIFWRNTTGNTITISNVKIKVAVAAAGTGAAAAFNVYKSSGTDANGIDTSAVNLFTSAIDLTTNYTSDSNTPNTATVEDGRWISLRCTASAGATNKAADVEVIIYYS